MLYFFVRPFTYDVHLEAISLFLVLLSSQMYGGSSSSVLLAVRTRLSSNSKQKLSVVEVRLRVYFGLPCAFCVLQTLA